MSPEKYSKNCLVCGEPKFTDWRKPHIDRGLCLRCGVDRWWRRITFRHPWLAKAVQQVGIRVTLPDGVTCLHTGVTEKEWSEMNEEVT